jgi:hypothetical protein
MVNQSSNASSLTIYENLISMYDPHVRKMIHMLDVVAKQENFFERPQLTLML